MTLPSHPSSRSHDHIFGQDQRRDGERRTLIVIAITLVMMVVEITAGIAFGSMALLADGLHMASHSAALAVTAFAYVYARKNAGDAKFSFGTGKVNALAGFTGALLLAGFSLFMAYESVERLINPVAIQFNWAIAVAVIGLIVNAGSMLILGDHGHAHDHGGDHGHHHAHHHPHEDHNLRSAYLHVMADALTSFTAIIALLAAKYFGWIWMDPVMGVVGACLVANWSFGLMRNSSHTLLDYQADEAQLAALREAIETDTTRIADLHFWSIGPGIHTAALTIESSEPRPPDDYRKQIPDALNIVHATIEVHPTQANS